MTNIGETEYSESLVANMVEERHRHISSPTDESDEDRDQRSGAIDPFGSTDQSTDVNETQDGYHVEEIFHKIGFGPYQKKQYALLIMLGLTGSLHMLSNVFLMATPEHRCFLGPSDIKYFEMNKYWNSSAYSPRNSSRHIKQCSYMKSTATESTQASKNSDTVANISTPCSEWIYDKTYYDHTAVVEWNLVCKESFWKAFSESTFMAGVLVGATGFGILSDRLGRKPVLLGSLVLQFVAGVLTGIMPEYYSFTFVHFIVGTSVSGVYLTGFVLVNEILQPEYRTVGSVVYHIPGILGGFALVGLAYYIRNWRYLAFALSLPGLIYVPYFWHIEESIRWMLANERKAKAEKAVRRAAQANGVLLPSSFYLLAPSNKNDEQAGILDLLKTPNMRRKTLCIFFLWFVCSLVYYGIMLNMEGLPGSDFVDFAISQAVELPSQLICYLILDRLGRRSSQAYTLLVSGFCCIATGFIPKNYSTVVLTMAMVGKLAINSAFTVVYTYSAEIFPTVTRSSGVGASSMCARVGGISAPFIILLDGIIPRSPYIIMGLFGILASLASWILPETANTSLPESILDGELFGKSKIKGKSLAEPPHEALRLTSTDISSDDERTLFTSSNANNSAVTEV